MSGLIAYAESFRDLYRAAIAVYADPAVALRAFIALARLSGDDVMSSLCRRLAISSMARVVPTVRIDTFDQAREMLSECRAVIGAEVIRAGDAGEDGPCAALRAVASAITVDIVRRGYSLAPLRTVDNPGALPAVVLAQRLYRDASRADELVARADAPNPLFLPTSFVAKSR